HKLVAKCFSGRNLLKEVFQFGHNLLLMARIDANAEVTVVAEFRFTPVPMQQGLYGAVEAFVMIVLHDTDDRYDLLRPLFAQFFSNRVSPAKRFRRSFIDKHFIAFGGFKSIVKVTAGNNGYLKSLGKAGIYFQMLQVYFRVALDI